MSNNNQIVTLGCRLNIFESEVIKKGLDTNNLNDKIVVNTCCVTKKAENHSISTIKKLKKQYPDKEIIVTGCAVHTALDKLTSMPEVSKIIDNFNKFSTSAFNSKERIITVSDNSTSDNNDYNLTQKLKDNASYQQQNNEKPSYSIPKLAHFENKTRSFIQIQQGCDHRCSFCIIHKARGASVSLSEADIINQIREVVNNGHKEVVLTGVDISSWERNIFDNSPSKLGELCINILKAVPNLTRLRLSSLDPAVVDHNIIWLLKNEPRFMPHLHLSLQSMSTPVLINMGRRHTRESATNWVKELQNANSNLVLGADIICGFPKETNEQFTETMESLIELNIPLLHVFPYSERSGTPAAKMQQLPEFIRKERALRLIEVAKQLKQNFLQTKLNQQEEVLVENNNTGYTQDYSLVKITNKQVEKNTLVTVKITEITEKYLLAEVI
ncbi:tRNA (N(6)-L-threonylcarbamoyladenosine(37)-C(2))-methylthiotransferase MtaB [Rickettsiales bacterium LUAb2]